MRNWEEGDIKMDRIIKSYLENFSKSFSLNKKMDDATKFEHFVNYTVIEPKSNTPINLEGLNIGVNGTIGIDGFAIILNNELISTEDELEDFISSNKKIYGEIVFIQSKTSTSFDSKDVSNFGLSVNDFISEDPKYAWSDFAKEKISLFNKLVSHISDFEENPTCNMYYVTLGIDGNDQNVYAKKDEVVSQIKEQNLFSNVNFTLIDNLSLQEKYKQIGKKLEKTFSFQQTVMLPVIKGVEQSYVGILNAKSLINLMTDDNHNFIPTVFYDNVRDFQGEQNPVNSEIQKTLESDYKDSFAVLNNGITIVAEELHTVRDNFTITNYQIINGCQTANVLFHNQQQIDDSVQVVLKLIISKESDVVSRIIQSTNSQTAIKPQDILAYSSFQKRLEDFYNIFSGTERLYYERRSKQYNSLQIEKNRIIDKTLQIKVIGSFYFDKPNLATRYFGSLFNEFKEMIFNDSDNLLIYYTAAYVYYKIDIMLKSDSAYSKYRKIKFLILTMFKYEIGKSKYPYFNSKDTETYCNDILTIVKDDNKFSNYFNSIISKIDKLKPDLTSTEISKSLDFVNKCMKSYPEWKKR